MRKLFLILLLVPCTLFSQTHSIDNTNLQASGLPTDFDITKIVMSNNSKNKFVVTHFIIIESFLH